jgi:hypothetical protein
MRPSATDWAAAPAARREHETLAAIDLESGFVRNIVLITTLAAIFHNAGARTIPNTEDARSSVDIAWLAMTSGIGGAIQLVGTYFVTSAHDRAVAAGHIHGNAWLVTMAWALAAICVAAFAVLYPVMIVAIR